MSWLSHADEVGLSIETFIPLLPSNAISSRKCEISSSNIIKQTTCSQFFEDLGTAAILRVMPFGSIDAVTAKIKVSKIRSKLFNTLGENFFLFEQLGSWRYKIQYWV